jgi:hypothetical protein
MAGYRIAITDPAGNELHSGDVDQRPSSPGGPVEAVEAMFGWLADLDAYRVRITDPAGHTTGWDIDGHLVRLLGEGECQ